MEITAGPVPSIKQILRLPRTDIDTCSLPWGSRTLNCEVRVYHRGTWALRDGIRLLLKKRGADGGRVWFPDYFCNEALAPLRGTKLELDFYPVTRDLRPDWERLEGMLSGQGAPDVMVLVHYFGFPNMTAEAERFCGKRNISLLEDAAHMLLPFKDTGLNNVTVFSPRKLLPLPEGGLLRIPWETGESAGEIPQMELPFALKWVVRSLMKAAVVKLDIPWYRIKTASKAVKSETGGKYPEKGAEGRAIPYLLSLLHGMQDNMESFMMIRKENYRYLNRLLKDVPGIDVPFPSLPEGMCPYTFPLFLAEDQEYVIKRLNEHYIPASDWPDLPPEVTGAAQGHEAALWMRKHVLLLPVHQGLDRKRITYIADALKETIREVT